MFKLVGPLAISSTLIQKCRCVGGFVFKIVVPVPIAVVGIHGIVADKRFREITGDIVAECNPLKLASDRSQFGLEFTEIIDTRHVFATTAAALGTGPGVVPLDGAVDLPVREDEIDIDPGGLVLLQERLDALPDDRDAMLERKRAAHRAAKRGLGKRPAVGINVLRLFSAIKKGVKASRGMDGNHPAQALLHIADSQPFFQ